MNNFKSVQAELLRPGQIRSALANRSVVYIPIGALEFHQEHLPIGLDALNAHGLACLSATRFGGIALPPLFYGTGGSHKSYPWTIMMDDETEIQAQLLKTLDRLQDFGVVLAVIFSGHFAPEQLEMIESIEKQWSAAGNKLRVISLAINMDVAGAPAPDHAGLFETTVLSNFQPETIDISQLPDIYEFPSEDPEGDPYGVHRHNQDHVLWGVFGPDPRNFDPAIAGSLAQKITDAIGAKITSALK